MGERGAAEGADVVDVVGMAREIVKTKELKEDGRAQGPSGQMRSMPQQRTKERRENAVMMWTEQVGCYSCAYSEQSTYTEYEQAADNGVCEP